MCPWGFQSSVGTVNGAIAASGGGEDPGWVVGALTMLSACIMQVFAVDSTSIRSSSSFSFLEWAESGVPVRPSRPFSRKSCSWSASPFSSSPSALIAESFLFSWNENKKSCVNCKSVCSNCKVNDLVGSYKIDN